MHPYESKLNTIPMAPTGHEDRSVQHFQDGRAGRFLRNVRPAGGLLERNGDWGYPSGKPTHMLHVWYIYLHLGDFLGK